MSVLAVISINQGTLQGRRMSRAIATYADWVESLIIVIEYAAKRESLFCNPVPDDSDFGLCCFYGLDSTGGGSGDKAVYLANDCDRRLRSCWGYGHRLSFYRKHYLLGQS